MRTLVRGLLALVLVGTTFTHLGAQEIRRIDRGHERHGFFLGLGGGAGSARIECDLCSNETEQGGAGWFTIGGTVGQHLRLAGDLNGWTQDDKGTRTSLMTGTFSALFYPWAEGNFFLKAGLGYSHTIINDNDVDLMAEGQGFGGVAGIGYDLWIGHSLSLTPQLTVFGGNTGDVKDGGTVALQDSNFSVAVLTLGLVFH